MKKLLLIGIYSLIALSAVASSAAAGFFSAKCNGCSDPGASLSGGNDAAACDCKPIAPSCTFINADEITIQQAPRTDTRTVEHTAPVSTTEETTHEFSKTVPVYSDVAEKYTVRAPVLSDVSFFYQVSVPANSVLCAGATADPCSTCR